ncbi:MAG: HAD family hydrolase [Prevotella sp.]|nr:HAD family hydrolase [Prevotella sp.]MDY4851607.1 HAD family hydrolase [Prevotella sp.]
MNTVILDFDGTLNKACTAIKTVKDTLKEMYAMGVTLILASNQDKEALEALLDDLNLSSLFSVIVTANEKGSSPQSGNIVNKVLEHTDTDPSQVLIVGENSSNIILGKQAGIKTCAVKCKGENMDTAGADYVIEDIRGLLDIV